MRLLNDRGTLTSTLISFSSELIFYQSIIKTLMIIIVQMKCLLRVPSRLIGAGGRPAAEAEGGGLDGGRGEGGAAPLQGNAVVIHLG